jgi:hypothetical protein
MKVLLATLSITTLVLVCNAQAQDRPQSAAAAEGPGYLQMLYTPGGRFTNGIQTRDVLPGVVILDGSHQGRVQWCQFNIVGSNTTLDCPGWKDLK